MTEILRLPRRCGASLGAFFSFVCRLAFICHCDFRRIFWSRGRFYWKEISFLLLTRGQKCVLTFISRIKKDFYDHKVLKIPNDTCILQQIYRRIAVFCPQTNMNRLIFPNVKTERFVGRHIFCETERRFNSK